MLFKVLCALLLSTVVASSIENNETNVGVFVNHLSSCNLNHVTGNMLCINQDFNTVIQYHDVKQVAMCPYHYCVLFNNEVEYSCTGYVLTLIGGKMDHHLNPLTPNNSLVGFTGNPDDDHVVVGTMFLGFNVLINFFEQDVDNHVTNPIDSIKCMDPYSTHISYKDGSEEMFGAYDIKFRGMIPSLLIGVVIHCSISFTLYIFTFSFIKCGRDSTFMNLCLNPLITFLCCILILFVAEDFVVKVYPFIISSIFGIVIGYILASILFNSILYCRRKKKSFDDVRIQNEEQTRFVISEDNDDDTDNEEDNKEKDGVQMVEIRLNDNHTKKI